jgi:hypothetical protein
MILSLKRLNLNTAFPYLDPAAAESFVAMEKEVGKLICLTMWWGPEHNLISKRLNKEVEPPGYSGHNFGFSIDLNLTDTLRTLKISYEVLLQRMKKFGWYCHRHDKEPQAPYSDHFNYLGADGAAALAIVENMNPESWGRAVEHHIVDRYGRFLHLSPAQVQGTLSAMKMYSGACTGNIDIMSREAILCFQRAWGLAETGDISIVLQRVLAFVGANRQFG